MKEWGVLTVDLKKVGPSSSLLQEGKGRATVTVENIVFFATVDGLLSEAPAVTAFKYNIVTGDLDSTVIARGDIESAGEIYWSHPSLIAAREKLSQVEN